MRRAKPSSSPATAAYAADMYAAASTRGPLPDAHMAVLMEPASEWNRSVDALHALSKTARSVCALPGTPGLDVLLNQIRHIAPRLPALVGNLRSILVKEGCETLQVLAALLGPPFVALVDVHVMPVLLKRACTTKAVIRDSAVAAACALFEHGLPAISNSVITHLSTTVVEAKAPVAMRSAAASFLGIIAAHPALPSTPRLRDALESAIACGVADSDETVRATSRRNWLAYVATNSAAAKALLDRIPLPIAHLILRESTDELPSHFLTSSPPASPDRPPPTARPRGPSRRVPQPADHVASAPPAHYGASPPRPSRVARASVQPNTLLTDVPPRPSRVARASLAPDALRSAPPPQRPSRVARSSVHPGMLARVPPAPSHAPTTATATSPGAVAAGAYAAAPTPSRNPFPPPPRPPALRAANASRGPRRSFAPGAPAALVSTQPRDSFHMEPPTPIADALWRAKAEAEGTVRPSAGKPPSPAGAYAGTTTGSSPAKRVGRSPVSMASKTGAPGHSRSPGVVPQSPDSTMSPGVPFKRSTEQPADPVAETPSPVKITKAAMETARTLLRSPAKSPASNSAPRTPPLTSRARHTPPNRPSPAFAADTPPSPVSRKRSGDDVVKPPSPERMVIVRRALRKPMRRLTIQPVEKEPASKSARKSPLRTSTSPMTRRSPAAPVPTAATPSPRRSPIGSGTSPVPKPSPEREYRGSQNGKAERSRKRVHASPPAKAPVSQVTLASPTAPRAEHSPEPSTPDTAKRADTSLPILEERDQAVAASSPQATSDSGSSEPTSSNESVPESVENAAPASVTVGTPSAATVDTPQPAAPSSPPTEASEPTEATLKPLASENSPEATTPETEQARKLRLSFIMGENKTPGKSLRKENLRPQTSGTESSALPLMLPSVPEHSEESVSKSEQSGSSERRGISVPDFDFEEEDDDDATVVDDDGDEVARPDCATVVKEEETLETDASPKGTDPAPTKAPASAPPKPKKEEELIALPKEEEDVVGKTEDTVVSVGDTKSQESTPSVSDEQESTCRDTTDGQTTPSEPKQASKVVQFSATVKSEDASPAKEQEETCKPEPEDDTSPVGSPATASVRSAVETNADESENEDRPDVKCVPAEDEAPSATVLDVSEAAPSSEKAEDGSRRSVPTRRVAPTVDKDERNDEKTAPTTSSTESVSPTKVDLKCGTQLSKPPKPDSKKAIGAGDSRATTEEKSCDKKPGVAARAKKRSEGALIAASQNAQKKEGREVVATTSASTGKPPSANVPHGSAATSRAAPMSRRAARRSVVPTRHSRASIAHAKMSSAQMRAFVGGKTATSGSKPGGASSRGVAKPPPGVSRTHSGITKAGVAKPMGTAGRGGAGKGGSSDVKTSPAKVEAVKRAASVPARVGLGTRKGTARATGAKGGSSGSRKAKGERSNVEELRAAVSRLRDVSGRTRGTWSARLEAVQAVTERLKAFGGESVPGAVGEECVSLIGEALHDVHHRVTMAGLDGMFFVLLCTSGAEDAVRLQRVLDKRPETVRRVLQLLRDGREDVRLAGGRVMQSFEVQFSAEAQVGLVLRAMAAKAAPADGRGAGVDERVGEMGCAQLVRAFERAERCEGGFLWTSALLQRVVTAMGALRRDRRVDVRRGADAVVAAMRRCLPDGAFEMACRNFNVSL